VVKQLRERFRSTFTLLVARKHINFVILLWWLNELGIVSEAEHISRNMVSNTISMFHCAFFNSMIDKHQHMHYFIQHCISLEC